MIKRRASKAIFVGNVQIGSGAPVVVQSMTKTDTRNVKATVLQILELEEAGCEVIRAAVPDMQAAEALALIKKVIHIPLIADIHFDYRLALQALKSGVDGLRLNPGNIGDPQKVAAVARAAGERSVPIRIGVNAGSLPSPGADLYAAKTAKSKKIPAGIAERMVGVAMEQIRLLESLDFGLIKVSLKAFDVPSTIEAYKSIADKMHYPLHLGITEAGPPGTGVIRSAVGIGSLLYMGIGDTIRVSLSSHPAEEVFAAWEIIKSLNLREKGPVLISCPSCGRAEVDILGMVKAVEKKLAKVDKSIKVAVMGCVVNGPGEARAADVGIACGKARCVLFKKGEILRTLKEEDGVEALLKEIGSFNESI